MLQSQIETQTVPHTSTGEATEELRALRSGVAQVAQGFDHTLIAAGTHPFAECHEPRHTDRARYRMVMTDLQMLGYRNLLCGMHVHVAVPDPSRRVALMTRALPFVPLFLALSTSSPFWRGRSTGLLSYRPAAYGELPRTGLPPVLRDEEEYNAFLDALVGANIIPDASYIWWSIRPSLNFPTLELRVADSVTQVEDAVAIAALFRALVHRLDRDPGFGRPVDAVTRAVAEENRWRVQRSGLNARIVDPRHGRPVVARAAIVQLLRDLAPDFRRLGGPGDADRVASILHFGTSAQRQVEVFENARQADLTREESLFRVASWLAHATVDGAASEAPPVRQLVH